MTYTLKNDCRAEYHRYEICTMLGMSPPLDSLDQLHHGHGKFNRRARARHRRVDALDPEGFRVNADESELTAQCTRYVPSEQDLDQAELTIGDHVIIGCHSCIIGGVTIGDCAIVAPNSLVISDCSRGRDGDESPARILLATASTEVEATVS
jgi:hypothetical protein